MLTRSRIDHIAVARDFAGRTDDWPLAPRFDPLRRWYHRLAATDEYEVCGLTRLPGQGTDLHDHGGSAGALAVVSGEVTEYTVAGPARVIPGMVVPRCSAPARSAGSANTTSTGSSTMATVRRSRVYVYGPALTTMSRYRTRDGRLVLAAVDRAGPAVVSPGVKTALEVPYRSARRGIDEILAAASRPTAPPGPRYHRPTGRQAHGRGAG